jgi:hypothetical protein
LQGTIQAVHPSKSGKSLSVNVDGQRFQAKHASGLLAHVGKTITFDPTEQKLDDGGVIRWINEFTLSGGSAPVAAPTQPGASPYQPLVSNLAAHLIAAGRPPTELALWVSTCKGILEGKLDTDVPY